MSKAIYAPPRTALFLPASNARAIEKAKGLNADMIILDLEDAVKAEDKDAARAAVGATQGFGDRPFGVRVNAKESRPEGGQEIRCDPCHRAQGRDR